MSNQQHIIQKLTVEIGLPAREEAFGLQTKITNERNRLILETLSEVFDRLVDPDEVVKINKLEIDLGTVPFNDFDYEFPVKVKTGIEEALIKLLHEARQAKGNFTDIRITTSGGDTVTVQANSQPKSFSLFEKLVHYLEFGVLPWSGDVKKRSSLSFLVAEAMTHHPEELRRVLHQLSSKRYIFRRLAFQLPEDQLQYLAAILGSGFSSKLIEITNEVFKWVEAFAKQNPKKINKWRKEFSIPMKQMKQLLWEETLFYFAGNQNSAVIGESEQAKVSYVAVLLERLFSVTEAAPDSLSVKYLKGKFSGEVKKALALLKEKGIIPEQKLKRKSQSGSKNKTAGSKNKPAGSNDKLYGNNDKLHGSNDKSRESEIASELDSEEWMEYDEREIDDEDFLPEDKNAPPDIANEEAAGVDHKTPKGSSQDNNTTQKNNDKSAELKNAGSEAERKSKEEALQVEKRKREEETKRKEAEDAKKGAQYNSESSDDFPLVPDADDGIYINNSGLVILAPYLPGFFRQVGLVEGKEFVNDMARWKAVHLLQYLAFGDEKMTGETVIEETGEEENSEEHDLVFNKIICGLDIAEPVPLSVELSEAEKEEGIVLLKAVIQHWEVIKRSSVHTLRTSFLQKEGRLTCEGKSWNLYIQRDSAVDMLIDRLPWGISMIKFPWKEDFIYVEW